MAYGLQVYNSSGQVRVDTTIMKGMTLVDVFKVNAGENKSESYPEHSGRTLKANAFRLDQSGGTEYQYLEPPSQLLVSFYLVSFK